MALAAHWVLFWFAQRIARHTESQGDDLLLAGVRGPVRWLLLLFGVGIVMESFDLAGAFARYWSIGSRMALAALIGWLVMRVLGAFRSLIELRSDISIEDNLEARRRQTRVRILYRMGQVIVGFVTIAMILIAIPSVRAIGVTLMASAGLAGLAIGAAAQPALKNLIAGIQMAFTEPIRLDDVVIVEGEWGRIEDIRLTFVVVRIWDDRRLIVPVSYFLEQPFQNWTRETSHLLGTVYFHVDPAADVQRIRDKIEQVAAANSLWDKRVVVLQVTEQRPEAMELRALVSARDAGQAWDLRCYVREAVLTFLREEMPEALPRNRHLLAGPAPDRPIFLQREIPAGKT
jgi:small-conductance mechanosensitive channel